MIRFLVHAISKSLGFSKVEARGTLILLVLLFSTAIMLHLRISQLKRASPKIELDSTASAWIKETKAKIKEKPSRKKTKSLGKNRQSRDKQYFPTDRSQPSTNGEPPDKTPIAAPIGDVNLARAEELQKVRGIGPILSKRIVKFRDLLGGFSSLDQINEVYGLDSTVVSNLLNDFAILSSVKPLPINSDSIAILAAHPYITFDLARIIINYRKAHGDIHSATDLKKIKAIDEATFNRLKPYLE